MITVVDYGMGNLHSVVKALELYSDLDVKISREPSSLSKSRAVVMPGDGAFGMAMNNLKEGGWIDPLKEYINSGGFFLGVCLGYQLLFDSSEEFGKYAGLGIIPGRVVRFPEGGLKVPHMGWNRVRAGADTRLFKDIENEAFFYFAHSYYAQPVDSSCMAAETEYGMQFASSVQKNNIFGVQFHPEKSGRSGLCLLRNYCRYCEEQKYSG